MASWYRRVFLLAIPLILSNLTQPLLSTVDTVLSGHPPGAAALGGVALSGLVFNAIFWTLSFLRMATTGLVAQAYGAGDHQQLRLHFARALLSSLAIGALVLLLRGVTLGLRLPRIEREFHAAAPAQRQDAHSQPITPGKCAMNGPQLSGDRSCILKLVPQEAGLMPSHYSTKFLLSAMAAQQFPVPSVPEIAFLGRSNVGKSSLLNALAGEKAAKVSSTPGRTRAINFFAMIGAGQRPVKIFADLPGYGYAKISKSISAGWPAFIEPYLAERPTLALCICLVDSNIAPQPSDRQLVEWMTAAGRDFAVVATKIDRLSGNERTRNLAALRTGLGVEDVMPVSSKTGVGMKDLWARIDAAGETT